MVTENDVRGMLAKVAAEKGWEPPPGAVDESVVAFCAEFPHPVPEAIRRWWRACNGPVIGSGALYGVDPRDRFSDIAWVYEHYPEWRDHGWLAMGEDGCGNYYVLDAVAGDREHYPVFFVDHEIDMGRPDYLVASGVWEFLWFYLSEELGEDRWPFDRDFVLAHDPEIIRFRDYAPLPWEVDEEP